MQNILKIEFKTGVIERVEKGTVQAFTILTHRFIGKFLRQNEIIRNTNAERIQMWRHGELIDIKGTHLIHTW